MSDEGSFFVQFDTAAIVGVGLIGGSLGMALKERRLARRVVGIGRNAKRLDQAVRLGAIDQGLTDIREGLSGAEIVIICTTVGNIIETLSDILRQIPSRTVVTDVGSTKSRISRQAGNAPNFVGSHPMAGSERTGVEAATPLLFQEATWALTPTEATDFGTLQRVRLMAQEVGANTLIISPEVHDAMVAITSHLPHVLSSALMRQASAARQFHPEIVRLAAGSFADMTRVSAASPDIWRDVCLSNREAVLSSIRGFRRQLDILEMAVDSRDTAALEAFFSEGSAAKRNWIAE
jgi:prephenate dehydrogenase